MFATARKPTVFKDATRATGMVARAKATQESAKQVVVPKTYPAPIRGWVLNENQAETQPGAAKILDNAFPTTRGVRVRRGRRRFATMTGAVEAIIVYKAGSTKKVFAASDNGIFDITSPATPTTVLTAVGGITWTDGAASYVQQNSGSGVYACIVNGSDERLIYDGTTWGTSPAITGGPGTNGNAFSTVWLFGSRQWFVEQGTMNAYYLGVDAISGAATKFALAGVFRFGGALLFGATWSADAGQSLRDRCVFVTTEGEIAVYEGYDPSSWSLSGVYRVGRPLGVHAWFRTGGDLMIATDDGIVPMSAVISKDPAAVAAAAITAPIDPAWRYAVAGRAGVEWHAHLWPAQSMVVISVPKVDGDLVGQCFVVNIITGAWARYTNWSGSCLALSDDQMLMGTPDATVMELEQGGSDDGEVFTSVIAYADDRVDDAGTQKVASLATLFVRAAHEVNPKISMQVDFSDGLPAPPSAASDTTASGEWDVGLWDVMIWGDPASYETTMRRQAVTGEGRYFAPVVQFTFGGALVPRIEVLSVIVNSSGGEATA